VPLDVVFLGTPEPAVDVLSALMSSSHRVLAVVTAPDRPRGRGMNLQPSSVKNAAGDVPVLQPTSLKPPEIQAELAAFGADAFVIAAFGLIVPQAVIDIPKFGCLNVHFSLLPRLRGAAPVQYALIEGLDRTGVTIIQIDAGLDAGPILEQAETVIDEKDNAGALEKKLAELGGPLMVEVLNRLESGQIEARPQDDALATYAPKITPEEARINWPKDSAGIIRRIRAFNPRPGAWTTLRSRRVKILEAVSTEAVSNGQPGMIRMESERLFVATGTTDIELEVLQPEGRRSMTAQEFSRGQRLTAEEGFS
jgi:methionyl-tRNA formyltransferase